MLSKSALLLGIVSTVQLVSGHCTLVGVKGDQNDGITGMGLGVTPGVNRASQIPKQPAGAPTNPEADTSVFGHPAQACGKTAMVSHDERNLGSYGPLTISQNGALKDTGSIMSAVQTTSNMVGGIPS